MLKEEEQVLNGGVYGVAAAALAVIITGTYFGMNFLGGQMGDGTSASNSAAKDDEADRIEIITIADGDKKVVQKFDPSGNVYGEFDEELLSDAAENESGLVAVNKKLAPGKEQLLETKVDKTDLQLRGYRELAFKRGTNDSEVSRGHGNATRGPSADNPVVYQAQPRI